MKKNNLIIAGIIVVVLLLGGYFLMGRGGSKTVAKPSTLAESEVIPTVDSSFKATVEGVENKTKAKLTFDGIPAGTTSIDYSVSYETESQGSQGIIGEGVEIKDGEKQFSVTRLLGTCSATCTYHKVVGKVRLEIKFTGKYGEKIYQNEYEL
jgi:hypothetical protein